MTTMLRFLYPQSGHQNLYRASRPACPSGSGPELKGGSGDGSREIEFVERAARSKSARDASITRLCHSVRNGRSPAAPRSRERKRSSVGADNQNVLLRLPDTLKAAVLFLPRRAAYRSERRRRTLRVSERGRRSAICIALSVPTLATMRPRSKRYARRPKNLQSSDFRQPWRIRMSTSVRGATSRPKVREPTIVA